MRLFRVCGTFWIFALALALMLIVKRTTLLVASLAIVSIAVESRAADLVAFPGAEASLKPVAARSRSVFTLFGPASSDTLSASMPTTLSFRKDSRPSSSQRGRP